MGWKRYRRCTIRPPTPRCQCGCGPSSRNTAVLLLLLLIAVTAAIVAVHGHEKREPPPPSDGGQAAAAPSSGIDADGVAVPPSASRSPPSTLPQAVTPDLVVAPDGTGNYTTVSEAVAAAPSNCSTRFVIRVRAGVYRENVKVTEEQINVMLVGDGMNVTVLTSNRSANSGWNTSYSATLVVIGDGFMAQDMTIENTAGPGGGQAVAVRSESDRSTFYRCSIMGYQDTLYAKHNRQFYRECDIYGTVDFIFGYAAAVFQNCNLYARRPLPSQEVIFTAQGRNSNEVANGFSIHNCTITAAPELGSTSGAAAAAFRSYLGRPWKEYSRTAVMQSFLGEIVDPVGWLAWNQSFNSTLCYAEYDNRGPGAGTTSRVSWPGYQVINSSEDASKYTVASLIDGDQWLPSTKVPYVGGLL